MLLIALNFHLPDQTANVRAGIGTNFRLYYLQHYHSAWKFLEIFRKIHLSRHSYCILCMHTKFHSIRRKIDGEKFAIVLEKSSTEFDFRKYYFGPSSSIFHHFQNFLNFPKFSDNFLGLENFQKFFGKNLAELPILVDFL